tara:strand:+ start:357 stop:599 length:243 start_codon:yes stop_codon:yes gene_type:complete
MVKCNTYYINGELMSKLKGITKKVMKGKSYYNNGKRKEKGKIFQANIKVKKWKYWNERGKLEKIELYDDKGNLLKLKKYD